MSRDVLQHHLLLLQRLEAALANVGGRLAQTAIGGGREVPGAAFALPARFHQSRFHQAVEHDTNLGFGFLDEAGCLFGGQASVLPEGVQEQKFIQTQLATGAIFFDHQADEVKVRLPSGEDHYDAGLVAAVVGGGGPAVMQLLVEDGVNTAGRAFDDARAFEGVGQERVTRTGRGHQQVVQADTVREAARVGNLKAVVVPLDMNGAQAGVVAVNQGVGEGLAERGGWVVRNGHSHHADEDLLLAVAGSEPLLEFFHEAQQRPAEEVVDLDALAAKDLKGGLVGG
ncbi:hypothetical protein Cabther_B0495 [Chloracidobacterium thermophilum B]|uniref:Uncharacterized protein n=1 Tax=Chloracidobacterium thermophilum (strain B) TaxID=981222 RepID=G2LLT1_CHLTF|nr:hypothetical protein Cabther_B0495 [Chloracidobacterium thermophilum B]